MPATNDRTGRRRRRPVRQVPVSDRIHALHSTQVSNLYTCQLIWSECLEQSLTYLSLAMMLWQFRLAYITANGDEAGHDLPVIDQLLQLAVTAHTFMMRLSDYYMSVDESIGDYTAADEADTVEWPEPVRRRIDDLDDREARQMTRFTKGQLRTLYNLFDLPVDVEGNVRIQAGNTDTFYSFHGEEVFLFSLTKLALGMDNTVLCMFFFGGAPQRWSSAYPWFLRYLDTRYADLLSFTGLERYVHLFPYFAFCIWRRAASWRKVVNPVTGEVSWMPGIFHIPWYEFRFFGFIDGSYWETCTPGTGPHGDYDGAQRNIDWYMIQRAVYTRYKRMHGLLMLTVMLPNGISFLYGPCSARRNDRGLVNMSNLDQHLDNIQNGRFPFGIKFSLYGDGVFTGYNCISSRHTPTQNAPLTFLQRLENKVMASVRISIEWSYSWHQNLFRILMSFKNWKLRTERPYATEQLRVITLLTNCYSCFNGNEAAHFNTFSCPTPTIEEYLVVP